MLKNELLVEMTEDDKVDVNDNILLSKQARLMTHAHSTPSRWTFLTGTSRATGIKSKSFDEFRQTDPEDMAPVDDYARLTDIPTAKDKPQKDPDDAVRAGDAQRRGRGARQPVLLQTRSHRCCAIAAQPRAAESSHYAHGRGQQMTAPTPASM